MDQVTYSSTEILMPKRSADGRAKLFKLASAVGRVLYYLDDNDSDSADVLREAFDEAMVEIARLQEVEALLRAGVLCPKPAEAGT